MEHYLIDLINNLNNEQKIVLKEISKILKDKNWHEIYEFHNKHRVSPTQIIESITLLSENKVIDLEGNKIRLSHNINNKGILLLNRLMKTDCPSILTLTKL